MATQPSKAQQVAEKRRKLKAQYAGGNDIQSGAQGQARDSASHDANQTSGSGQLSEQELPDIASAEQDKARRVLFINDAKKTFDECARAEYAHAGNVVRTSKYTFLTFLPRNLFEQFHRVAYLYFLVIVILNQFPQLAVFGRTASIFPLAFVLVVTALKDGYEDFGRHRSDRKENNRLAYAFSDGEFRLKKWKSIRVGEVLKIYEKETVPCDVALLGTSDPSGVAYIETLNLDGESNLKSRYARQETVSKMQNVASLAGTLTFEHPNRNIYGFTAYMDLDGVQLPLGPNNMVLRGCEVKNTSWIIGVVVYAGQETKAMLNSSGAQSKRSRLEKQMNREIAYLAVFLILTSLVGGIGMGFWVKSRSDDLDIIPYYIKTNPRTQKPYHFYGQVGEAIFGFLGCVITFQVMVPISLYISMELVRLGQSYFMTEDADMYHAQTNSPFQARALNINEDLGQIKFLFSDKTGTLTENKMEFQTASISGVDYANATLFSESALLDEGSQEQSGISSGSGSKRTWRPRLGSKLDPRLVSLLQSQADTVERREAHDFMLALTACNTVVPDSTAEQLEAAAAGDVSGAMKYQAESPDEHALVSAAAQYGYVLLERSSEHLLISVLGSIQRFAVLGVHEFDSVRKRMSVVLKCPDGTVKVFVKGADTEVLEQIAVQSMSNQGMSNDSASKYRTEVMLSTLSHLDGYAREGLRTLVVAVRQLDEDEVATWQLAHSKASISLRNRVSMMRSAAELVERNLTLLGATGIEDKLQDGVPETIASLREAGIKVWVLTGDKQETAISIAFSCLLLTREMEQIIVNESTKEGCRDALLQARIKHRPRQQEVSKAKRKHRSAASEHAAGSPNAADDVLDVNESEHHRTRESTRLPLALIIDGNSLVHALGEELEKELVELALLCEVVLCCRVAPLQKAGLVSLVKKSTNELTLAVGDGANDVSMIQVADVGVGITGQEGRQAVMASDFAIGQFRFLKKLLLVHGHWNYHRLGYMVLYNFYRNAVFVMLLFWYILYTAFSPSPALTDWNLVFYSLIYTSVPTIVAGILDKDISKETLMAYPPLYGPGQRGEAYNRVLFWASMLDTFWQSLVLFYVAFFTFNASLVEIWSLGELWTVGVVVLVTLQLALHIRTWTWIHHVALWGSVLATFICLFVMDAWVLESLLYHYWSIYHIIFTAPFWLDIFLMLALALLPHFFVLVVQQRFWPSDIDIGRELESRRSTVDRASVVELNEVPHVDRGQTDA